MTAGCENALLTSGGALLRSHTMSGLWRTSLITSIFAPAPEAAATYNPQLAYRPQTLSLRAFPIDDFLKIDGSGRNLLI